MKYIVELSKEELRAISKGLHILLIDDKDSPNVRSALDSLVAQTDFIFRDHEKHGVFDNALTSPMGTKKLKDVYHFSYSLRK